MRKTHREKVRTFVAIGMACLSLVMAGCKSKVAFGLNSGRVDKTRETVETTISDPVRSATVLKLIDSFEKEMKGISTETIAIRAKIIEANQNYDTTREELEELYAQLNGLIQKLGDTAKRYSLEVRKHCSETEWKKIASQRADAINFNY